MFTCLSYCYDFVFNQSSSKKISLTIPHFPRQFLPPRQLHRIIFYPFGSFIFSLSAAKKIFIICHHYCPLTTSHLSLSQDFSDSYTFFVVISTCSLGVCYFCSLTRCTLSLSQQNEFISQYFLFIRFSLTHIIWYIFIYASLSHCCYPPLYCHLKKYDKSNILADDYFAIWYPYHYSSLVCSRYFYRMKYENRYRHSSLQ